MCPLLIMFDKRKACVNHPKGDIMNSKSTSMEAIDSRCIKRIRTSFSLMWYIPIFVLVIESENVPRVDKIDKLTINSVWRTIGPNILSYNLYLDFWTYLLTAKFEGTSPSQLRSFPCHRVVGAVWSYLTGVIYPWKN